MKNFKQKMVKGVLGIASIAIMNACTGCGAKSETIPANIIGSSTENYNQTNNYNNVTSYDYKNESSQNWNIIEDENISYTAYVEDNAIGENDYNSVLTEDIVRRNLDVPDYANITIEYTMPDYDNETGENDICAVVYENGTKVASGRFSIESGQATGKKAYSYQPPETEDYAEVEEEYEEPDYNNDFDMTHYENRLDELDNQIGDAIYYPEEYFEMCDELLNDVYQDIKEDLSDSDYQELKQSELSWLDDREQIDSSGDEYWFARASETLNRVHWLLENYGYCID